MAALIESLALALSIIALGAALKINAQIWLDILNDKDAQP